MKFNIMQHVYIQSDVLNLDAPVGETGFIIHIDPRVYNAESYCVRVPSRKDQWWLPECDLIDAEEWLSGSAERAISDSLVNDALDRKDETAFLSLMKIRSKKHSS
jgi:hypothetical protein